MRGIVSGLSKRLVLAILILTAIGNGPANAAQANVADHCVVVAPAIGSADPNNTCRFVAHNVVLHVIQSIQWGTFVIMGPGVWKEYDLTSPQTDIITGVTPGAEYSVFLGSVPATARGVVLVASKPPDIEPVAEEIPLNTLALNANGESTETGNHCWLYLYGEFHGWKERPSGYIYGSWGFYGHTSCPTPMEYMSVGSWLYKGGTKVAQGPLDQCWLSSNPPCQVVHSPGSYACALCNGTWIGQSKHRIRLPGGWVWASGSPYCTGTSTDITCTLTDAATLS